MFQFSRFASIPYVFRYWYPCGWVSPFRNLRIKAHLPAPRSLSHAITSFFACHRQGIHHMLLVTWPYNFDAFAILLQKIKAISRTCQVFHLTRYAVMWIIPRYHYQETFVITEFKLLRNHFRNHVCSLNIRFDAIKNLSPGARSVLNLYECAVSPGNSDFDSMNF